MSDKSVHIAIQEWSDKSKDIAVVSRSGSEIHGYSEHQNHNTDAVLISRSNYTVSSNDDFSGPVSEKEKSLIDYDWRDISDGPENKSEVESRTIKKSATCTVVKSRSNPYKQSDWLHRKIPVTDSDPKIKELSHVLPHNALNNLCTNRKLFGKGIVSVLGNSHSVNPCGGFMWGDTFIRINPFAGGLEYRDATQALVTLDDGSKVAIWKASNSDHVHIIREYVYDGFKIRSPILKLNFSQDRTTSDGFHSSLEENNPFSDNSDDIPVYPEYEDPFEDTVDDDELLKADPRRYISFKLGAFKLRNKQSQLLYEADKQSFLSSKSREMGRIPEANILTAKALALKHCAKLYGACSASIEGVVDRIFRLDPRTEDGQKLAGAVIGGQIGQEISKLVIGAIEGKLNENVNKMFTIDNLGTVLYSMCVAWLRAAGYSIADGILQGLAKELLSKGLAKKIPSVGILIGSVKIISNACVAKNLSQGVAIVGIGAVSIGVSYGCTVLGTSLIPIPFVGSMVGAATGSLANNLITYGFQKATGIKLDPSTTDHTAESAASQIHR